jgi:hypothetical protein
LTKLSRLPQSLNHLTSLWVSKKGILENNSLVMSLYFGKGILRVEIDPVASGFLAAHTAIPGSTQQVHHLLVFSRTPFLSPWLEGTQASWPSCTSCHKGAFKGGQCSAA